MGCQSAGCSLVASRRQAEEVENLVKESTKKLGHIDIVINNAGIQHVHCVD